MNKNSILETVAILCREVNGKLLWFVVKQSENGDWEFPRAVVKRGESSVRAALRIIGQQAAINARVLEEAGRTNGFASLNGKTIPKKTIYYLMFAKHIGSEVIGFLDSNWCEYPKASRLLKNQTDLSMLKNARSLFRDWKKKNNGYEFDDEEDFPKDEIEDEPQEEI